MELIRSTVSYSMLVAGIGWLFMYGPELLLLLAIFAVLIIFTQPKE